MHSFLRRRGEYSEFFGKTCSYRLAAIMVGHPRSSRRGSILHGIFKACCRGDGSHFPGDGCPRERKRHSGSGSGRPDTERISSIGSPEWKNLREDYRNQLTLDLINVLINSKLLYQKAVESGFKVSDEEVQAEFQKIAKTFKDDAEMNAALAAQNTDRAALEKNLSETMVMSKFVEESVNKKVAVTQEELAKYYSSNPTEFHHPDLVRTSHILIRPAGDTPEQDAKARERAESLLARIKKGEDFAKLARENSVDASASQGGDIGLTSKAALDPDYAAAAFSLPVGGLKVVKSQFGYHVIKVTDKKEEGVSTLEEVKEGLAEFLKSQKAQEELNKFVGELRNKAKIEILLPIGVGPK